MCNHDLNEADTTIVTDKKKKTMAHPNIILGICKQCKKSFKFEKVDELYVSVEK